MKRKKLRKNQGIPVLLIILHILHILYNLYNLYNLHFLHFLYTLTSLNLLTYSPHPLTLLTPSLASGSHCTVIFPVVTPWQPLQAPVVMGDDMELVPAGEVTFA